MDLSEDNFQKKSPSQCGSDFLATKIKYEEIEYLEDFWQPSAGEDGNPCQYEDASAPAFEELLDEENDEEFEYSLEPAYELKEDNFSQYEKTFERDWKEIAFEENRDVNDEFVVPEFVVPCPESAVCVSSDSESFLTRKRKKHPELWKQNIRNRQRESGEKYVSIENKEVPPKVLKETCNNSPYRNCSFNCISIFTAEERLNIFKSFWSLSDNEKTSFYFKFVTRDRVKHSRKKFGDSNKQFSFKYYFEKNQSVHRVCRLFFLNTLSIDQKRIYYCFKNLKNEQGSPILRTKGKNVKGVTAPEKLLEVREHISSFKAIDSHYCRARTNKKYLDSSLNLTKMHNLYIQKYENPVSIHIYKKVFNNEYNISFHKPKKDQCDKCVLFRNKENVIPPEEKEAFKEHHLEKVALKCDRDNDRNNTDSTTCIMCYDLQSVFSIPKGNASAFYYKRKFSMYNLTATIIIPNVKPFTYCALWTEAHSGRSGNDIASALIKILGELVKDFSGLKKLILWSDSCVPQNKNKINSTAIKMFLKANSYISTIIQKFSEPGHSLIQEVDCVHSVIDAYLKKIDIHSPDHLIMLLKNMPSNKTRLVILELVPTDFYLYSAVAKKLEYSKVPFSKIKIMIYKQTDEFRIQFKNSTRETFFKNEAIIKSASKNCIYTPLNVFKEKLNIMPKSLISKEKKNDLKDLLKFLPTNHSNCLKHLLQI